MPFPSPTVAYTDQEIKSFAEFVLDRGRSLPQGLRTAPGFLIL